MIKLGWTNKFLLEFEILFFFFFCKVEDKISASEYFTEKKLKM